MTDPRYPAQPMPGQTTASRPAVNAGRLWMGGAATAIVAALIVLVGLMISRVLLDVPVIGPEGARLFGDSPGIGYAVGAAIAALLATGLLHLMLLGVPSPLKFFGWIGGLATAVAALMPLTLHDSMAAGAANGVINLVTGLAITTLLISIAPSR